MLILNLLVVCIQVAVALEVLVKFVGELASDVLDWVLLVSSKDVHGWCRNLLVLLAFRKVSLYNSIHVFWNSGVDIGKFDIPLLQMFVLLQFDPLWDKSIAVFAFWIHESDDPEMIIIAHHNVVEV